MSSFLSTTLLSLRRSSSFTHNPLSQSLSSVRQKCKRSYSHAINWSYKKGRKLKGIAVTGATATTCAVVYFTHGHEKLLNSLKVIESHATDDESIPETDVFHLFYEVGFEDDWLACPLSALASQSRKVYESSAFIKLNVPELLSPWEQSSSDDPWVLLHLTKTGNFWVRQIGVACLADKTDWEAYKYRNVAQACDYKTLIALARYPQANDAYFFPQPKLCLSEADVVTGMQNLLMNMPSPDNAQSSLAFYRALALQREIKFQRDPLTMDVLTHFYTTPGEEEKKMDQGLRHCLLAFEAYTSEAYNAILFVKLHGMGLLQQLHENNEEEWVQMYILNILNNLSQVSELRKNFVRAGWIHELRNWSKGDNTILSIMADTVLANLDRDWISSALYKNMMLLHPTQRNSQPVTADIVLVHGLKGSAVKTWRQRDQEPELSDEEGCHSCWPKDWLSREFQGTRIISVGYTSALHQWEDHCPYESERRTLHGRSEELIQHLLKADIGSRPIIWMGHSMGGLLIKEILYLSETNPSLKKILDNTKGIIMYSVPHKGSDVVDTMMYAKYLLFPSVEVQEMSTHSSKLKLLHERFLKMVSSYLIPCLSFGENVKTEFGGPFPSLLLVSQESSDPGVGQFITLSANHINTCKPRDKEDPIYIDTLNFLRTIFNNLQTNR